MPKDREEDGEDAGHQEGRGEGVCPGNRPIRPTQTVRLLRPGEQRGCIAQRKEKGCTGGAVQPSQRRDEEFQRSSWLLFSPQKRLPLQDPAEPDAGELLLPLLRIPKPGSPAASADYSALDKDPLQRAVAEDGGECTAGD